MTARAVPGKAARPDASAAPPAKDAVRRKRACPQAGCGRRAPERAARPAPAAAFEFGRVPVAEPRIGTWARALLRAPETQPADATERAAERVANGPPRADPGQGSSAAGAPETGTPPWGAGRPLNRAERSLHESRAGTDLGEVRIHEGEAAARWARVLGARAFTIGRDVVLGEGEYAPGSESGRRLMAHELAHVVAGRGRTPLLARSVSLTAADYDALSDSLHAAASSSTSDRELIFVALQKLERDPAAIRSLTVAYRRRFSSDLLADLAARLSGQDLALARTLLGQASRLAVAATAPTTPAQFEASARAVNAALVARPIDVAPLYAALLPLGRAPAAVTSLKAAYRRLFSIDLEADLQARLAHAALSYALYLLDAPGPAATHTPPITYASPPTLSGASTTAAVGGGTVSAGVHVPYTAGGSPTTFGFGYGYSGALSADTRWLQFIEREIDATVGATTSAVAANVTVGSRTYALTTRAASPSWGVDSDYASSPFFDETHPRESWRDPTSASAYDSPTALNREVSAQFAAGATSVMSRAHFDVYLIRDFAPIFHVEIEIRWTFAAAPPARPTISRNVIASGAVTSLPTAQKTALVARYPAFAYIT